MRVPTYKRAQTAQPAVNPVVPLSANKVGPAMVNLADTASNVAFDISKLYEQREAQREKENNLIKVTELYYGPGGFKDTQRKMSEAARATVGDASKNIGNDYVAGYDKAHQEFLMSDAVENDEQRLLLNELILKNRDASIRPVAAHQAQQHQLRKKAAADAVITDAIRSVTENPAVLGESLEQVEMALKVRGGDYAKEYASIRKQLEKAAEESTIKAVSDSVWAAAMKMPIEDGEKAIMATALPRETKNKLLKDYRDEKTIQTKREEDELKQARDATANEFDQKIGELSIAEVETSNLEPGTGWGKKDYYRNKITERAEKIKKEQKDPFTEFDPATKSELQQRANTAPEGLTNEDIWSLVGKGKDGGITSSQAQEIQSRRDANLSKVDKGKRNGQAHKIISGLETKKVFNPEDPATNIFDAQRWRDALDQYINENPDGDPVKWVEENVKGPVEKSWYEWLAGTVVGLPGKVAYDVLHSGDEGVMGATEAAAGQQADPKRQKAIDILKKNNKAVTEQTIKIVMDRL